MDDEVLEQMRSLEAVGDLVARIKRANELVAYHQEVVGEVSRLRREALIELSSQGHNQSELARLLDMTRSRVQQLLTTGPKVERALLGTGPLTVSIGGKWEAQKANPSAVVSAESLGAYQVLADLASGYGLTASYEIVPPPGMVRLNKNDLVVIGSPRILPIVGQVLESDANLAFDVSAQGWYLRDHQAGVIHKSPSDAGESKDYAYIGRLPRPDGKGTFLYLAGIHAMGTLGAAQFLAQNIEEIYKEVKGKRWSILVECSYDPDARSVIEAKRLTPTYVAA